MEKDIRDILQNLDTEQTGRLLEDMDMEATAAQKRRILRSTRKKCGVHKNLRRIWVPLAACAGVGVMVLILFPGTASALKGFFQRTFQSAIYFNTPAEQREKVPEVEAIIEKPESTSDVTVLLGAEIEGWTEDVEKFRAEGGFKAFDEKEYTWLRDVKVEITEVMYDSRELRMTGYIHADDARLFYPLEGAEQLAVTAETILTYTDNGEEHSVRGWTDIQSDQNATTYGDNEVTFHEDYIMEQKKVPINAYFWLEEGQSLPSGMLDARLSMDIYDARIDDMNAIAKVAQLQLEVPFDTTRGNSSRKDLGKDTTHILTGEAIFTHKLDDDFKMVRNEHISMDGFKIELQGLEQTQTGMTGIIINTLPESWTDEQRQLYENGGIGFLNYMLVVDGQESSYIEITGDYFENVWSIDIPILQSELDAIESLKLVPILPYTKSINGTELPLGKDVETGISGSEYQAEEGYNRFEDYAFILK